MYDMKQIFNVTFEVKKIIYRKENSLNTIINAKLIEHNYKGAGEKYINQNLIIKGTFMNVYIGDIFSCNVKWEKNNIYGYQLSMTENPKIKFPELKKGLSEFLRKRVKGLGKVKANNIVNKLGLDCISIIINDWRVLLSVDGIKMKMAEKIYNVLNEEKKFENISIFIHSMGMNQEIAIQLYELFKDDVIIKINKNPYSICCKNIEFNIADKFAERLNKDSLYIERIKEGIMYFITMNLRNKGNLFLYKETILNKLDDFLCFYGAYKKVHVPEELINKAINELSNEFKIVIENDKNNNTVIYRKDYYIIEESIVKNLSKIITTKKEPLCLKEDIVNYLDRYEEKYFKLADKQRQAVLTALTNRISIITGGPGTGKTQTVNTIIKCIKEIKPKAVIKLSAPTGKASKRITELTNNEACTIHRLINLNAFSRNKELEEIKADYIIIDESSMIDAYIFNKLLQCIDDDTSIILVGDYEQLPSVGPGLILRDLITSQRIPVTTLDEIFRQAQNSQIVMNSHKIIKGNTNLDFDKSKEDFYFIKRKDPISIQKTVELSINNLIKNKGYKLEDICVLTPMRNGEVGVYALNSIIQKKFNKPTERIDLITENGDIFRNKDRVIQIKNDYDKEVFNGEVGVIIDIYNSTDGTIIKVDYSGKEVEYLEKEFIDEVELAYAMTIHKSQGSEFKVVIIPIHETNEKMLYRNLIYTGLTRAKKMVVLIGSEDVFRRGILKNNNIERLSGIKEKLSLAI